MSAAPDLRLVSAEPAATRPAAIVTRDLGKSFGDHVVLAGVSMEITAGTVYGLLGPNGAGKSTLIRILTTLIPASSGTAAVAGVDIGRDPAAVRPRIGLAGQFAAVDGHLTGRENLQMVGELYNLRRREARARAAEVLERIHLTADADRPVRDYSGGMRRRLDLAASMVGRPEVLFLDEPTTGVDPRARLDIWDLIHELVDDGTTLLLTTQYLDEAEQLADTIGVIAGGKLIAEGTAAHLKQQFGGDRIEVTLAGGLDDAIAVLDAIGRPLASDHRRRSITLPAPHGAHDLSDVLDRLEAAGIAPVTAGLQQPSLDDVFLTLTASSTSSPTASVTASPTAALTEGASR